MGSGAVCTGSITGSTAGLVASDSEQRRGNANGCANKRPMREPGKAEGLPAYTAQGGASQSKLCSKATTGTHDQ